MVMYREGRTFYPEVKMANKTLGLYRVELLTMGHFDDQDERFLVNVFYKWWRVSYQSFEHEADAVKFFQAWTEEWLPVQIAKEAHGLAERLNPMRKTESEL